VPVYFLFESAQILCREDSKFSAGNLGARSTKLMQTAVDFAALPFEDIYHAGAFSKQDRDRIVNRRHAEVVVPRALPLLPAIRRIVCRSTAERETLALLLGDAWPQWRDMTAVSTQRQLFFRKWNYVERVTTSHEELMFHCHAAESDADRGPFSFFVQVNSLHTGASRVRQWDGQWPENTLRLDLSDAGFTDYEFVLRANDDLVCAGRHIDILASVPF
jgi:hypothetical protein